MTGGKILIIQFSASRDGSAVSGLMLADGLKEQGWHTSVVFGHEGPMIDVYRAAGHQVEVLEHKSWLRRAQPLRFLKDVFVEWRRAAVFERLIKQLIPDVIYINTSVSLAAALAARRCKVPLIWHLRELFGSVGGELVAPSAMVPSVKAAFPRLADCIIANSRAVAANLLGPKANIAQVVHNAVDDEFFESALGKQEACKRLGLDPEKFVIGVPGTLRSMKGHPFFFDAAAIVCRENPNVMLAITGDGKDDFKHTLVEQIRELGLEKKVVFLGVLDGLENFYPACDLICVPSESEPFGRVVIEAMACGKPVIATSVGGIPEILTTEVNGLLVPSNDVPMLASSLTRLITDEELRQKLADAGKENANCNYREKTYKSRIGELVDEAGSERP